MITLVGMHRSGTSALAGALYMMGANLGKESSWLAAAADNPRGFFEYLPVLDLDRDILAAFGGTWSSPPALPEGWIKDGRLDDLREQALRMSETFPLGMIVKDPRLSLVQPLWAEVTRIEHTLMCLRHPMAVANSLQVRNGFSIDQGLFLWYRYTAAALINCPGALVVGYETLLQNPKTELTRVADHLGANTSDTTIAAAASTLDRQMVHHEGDGFPNSAISIEAERLYDYTRSRPVIQDDEIPTLARLLTELPWAGPAEREIQRAWNNLNNSRNEVAQLIAENDRIQTRLARVEQDLRACQAREDLSVVRAAEDVSDLMKRHIR